MNKKYSNEKINGLVKLAGKQIYKFLQSEELKKYLDFRKLFYNYSLQNQILIYAQCPEATFVKGYNSWKKLDRYVQAGSKAIKIIAPLVKKQIQDNEEQELLFGYKAVNIFDISQTNGKDIPRIDITPSLTGKELISPEVLFEKLSFYANSISTLFLEDDLPYLGCTDGNDYIKVRKENNPLNMLLTLVHELSHFLNHFSDDGIKKNKSQIECEAELTGYIFLTEFNFNSSNSFKYVAKYTNSKVPIDLYEAFTVALKTYDTLVEALFKTKS